MKPKTENTKTKKTTTKASKDDQLLNQRKWQGSYVKRMKEKGFFYFCRWIKSEHKKKAIETIEKLNR